MKAIVFAFLAVACLAVQARNLQPLPKSLLTDIIKGVINNNRDKLANLQIETIPLGTHGSLNGLTLSNLENFSLDKLEAPGPLSFTVSNATVSLDWAEGDGSYVFVDVGGENGIPNLNGEGSLKARLEKGWVTAELDFKLQGLTTLVLLDIKNFAVSVGVTNIALDNIDGGDETNNQLSAALPSWIQSNLPVLLEANKALVIEKINEVLAGLTP